jgi:hypothetical protein
MTSIESVVEALARAGGVARGHDGAQYRDPRPASARTLAALRPLPPALRTWLSFDADWLGLLTPAGRWRATTFGAYVRGQVEEAMGESDEEAAAGILSGQPLGRSARVLQLPSSASQDHLLVLAREDGPVWGWEKEELWEKYPSFADFLAHYFGMT